jgi:hypothetical protein
MEKTIVKQHLIEQQEALIADLKTAIRNLTGVSDLDEGESILIDDLSHQGETQDLVLRMRQQLDNAQNELDHLNRLPTDPSDEALEGALVITDKAILYIGISAMHSTIGNHEVIGISTQSPIFCAMHGKKAGEQFRMGKKIYTIKEIL